MLKKDDIAKLKKKGITINDDGTINVMGVDMKTLNEAISSKEEVDYPEPTIVAPEKHSLLSDEELEVLKTTAKNEGAKSKETSMPEILAKLYKEKYGIKLDTKDLDEVIKAIALTESEKAVNAAKLTVDEQVKLKDTDIATLRQNVIDAQAEGGKFKTEAETYKSQLDSVNEMQEFSSLISGKSNPIFKANELRTRFREEEGFDIKKVNGTWIKVDLEGKPIQDKLLRNIPANTAIDETLSKRKEWAKPIEAAAGAASGGHGTGSSGGGQGNGAAKKYNSLSELKEAKNAEKWDGRRYQQEYTKAVAENPEFNAKA
jgi:hypothetical protein